jgi:hypothetical protein
LRQQAEVSSPASRQNGLTRRQDDGRTTRTSASGTARKLVDRDGERIGKLEDVYVDVETERADVRLPSRRA